MLPKGVGIYVRKISVRRHQNATAFARKCRKHGISWVALGGIWQEGRKDGSVRTGWINKPDVLKAYADALTKQGIDAWVWGYPWMGEEQLFVDRMMEPGIPRILLDPELGSNPDRASKGAGKAAANKHAELLVSLFAEHAKKPIAVGLSTFGSGYRLKWFPLMAFAKALAMYFPEHSFIGGQTYTDNDWVDMSIADMAKVADKYGLTAIVPNFGIYKWDTPTGKRRKGAKAVRKTPQELRLHLHEFINEGEPVEAVIGWAENFLNDALWEELAKFAALMERGACSLRA